MSDRLQDEQLKHWLVRQPREVISNIATRAALRDLPSLNGMIEWPIIPKNTGVARVFILPLLRGLSAAWFFSNYPKRATEILPAMKSSSNAAKNAALRLDKMADTVRRHRGRRAREATRSGFAACHCATSIAELTEWLISTNDENFYADVEKIKPGYFKGAVGADAHVLEIGQTLNSQPLWLVPVDQDFEDDWLDLKRALLRRGKNWSVWTDWYEARLRGDPANEELEIARILIPNEIWDLSPTKLNLEIKKLIELSSQMPKADVGSVHSQSA